MISEPKVVACLERVLGWSIRIENRGDEVAFSIDFKDKLVP